MNKVIDINDFSSFKNIKTKDNQYLRVNPFDLYISRNLINYGEWEPHIRQMLNNLCKPDMTVMDIGANIGAHTVYMSKLVGENGKVIAFEPCKSHTEILFYNLMINNCFNTQLYSYGCSDNDATMFIDERFKNTKQNENFGCIVLKNELINKNDEIIETRTIDSFNFPKIDVVKIDAEYMENKVICGMKNTILKYKPIIIIEIHNNELKNMTDIFDSIDYKIERISNSCDFLALPKN